MSFNKPIQWHLKKVSGRVCIELEAYQAVIYNKKGDTVTARRSGRHIREAIWIRKTDNMNRDEGSYQLSHVWDKFLHTDDR